VTTADVVDALNYAKAEGLEIAVRGGGHNVAGRAVSDGGVMIDLAPMKGIHVDPRARTATAQPGLLWKDFNRATQLYGLATTGGVIGTTGIAGLTLGGGLGWLMGKYGMAVDNLLAAEVVLANGEVVTASADENPDLFWAIRGGGGNFGIVTSFTYRLHPVGPVIYGGLRAYPFERAAEVLRFYRDFTTSLPDEMTMFGALTHAPDGSGMKIAGLLAGHAGTVDEGEAAFAGVDALGEAAMDAFGPLPYSMLNGLLDEGFPKGALNYWKSSFLSDLTDDAIDILVEQFAKCPSPMGNLVLEHFHGAVTRVPVDAVAYPHRMQGHNLVIIGQWLDAAETATNIAWVRETYDRLEPLFANQRYVNYMPDDETDDALASAYGPNYARLRELKRLYDPENLFHMNQNILPV
jgi:FAD/FMN-containing dehydrogenase